jgi:hypothetical protein
MVRRMIEKVFGLNFEEWAEVGSVTGATSVSKMSEAAAMCRAYREKIADEGTGNILVSGKSFGFAVAVFLLAAKY